MDRLASDWYKITNFCSSLHMEFSFVSIFVDYFILRALDFSLRWHMARMLVDRIVTWNSLFGQQTIFLPHLGISLIFVTLPVVMISRLVSPTHAVYRWISTIANGCLSCGTVLKTSIKNSNGSSVSWTWADIIVCTGNYLNAISQYGDKLLRKNVDKVLLVTLDDSVRLVAHFTSVQNGPCL